MKELTPTFVLPVKAGIQVYFGTGSPIIVFIDLFCNLVSGLWKPKKVRAVPGNTMGSLRGVPSLMEGYLVEAKTIMLHPN